MRLSSAIFFLVFSIALTLTSLSQEVILNEFLASNVNGQTDEDGDESDWIELSNQSGSAVDLAGWSLTDDADDLRQWIFPSVTVAAGGKLLVFASGKDRAVAGSELHTNFKLRASGEYLALIRPDGITVASELAPAFPVQYPDTSYGVATEGEATAELVGSESPLRYLVPEDASVDVGGANPFHELNFDDSAWTPAQLGVGFATTTALDPYDEFIGDGGEIQSDLYLRNSTVYVRIPFVLDDPGAVTALLFRARYDDGFGLYLNGSSILASALGADDGVWDFDARASANHRDSDAVTLEPFTIDLNDVNLLAGENVLAVHGLNRSPSSSDFLFDCELSARLAGDGTRQWLYLPTPTPEADNGNGSSDLGPIIQDVTENPERPDPSEQSTLLITAQVAAAGSPVERVVLFHRQGFGGEDQVDMRDDGVAPDEIAGDGVYSAAISLGELSPGEMLRWRVEARDDTGVTSRNPLFFDPLNSPEYYGTVALDESVISDLPVLEWFIENPSAANSRQGTRVAVFHLGEFYDNVFCRIRGGSSTALAKKSYKFDLNPGHHFRAGDRLDGVRAEEFNLNTTWTDKAYLRQPLTYEVYDLAGSPGSECFLMRVEQNGSFFSVAAYTEQVDKRLLRREKRMDDDGALYKMFNAGDSAFSGVEKKNRRFESNADLAAFLEGMRSSGQTLENYIFDHVDLPRQLNYLAATVLTQNNDNMRKNYYLYRDTEGSGEWTQLPWDTDLTWGSHYMTNDSISDDGIWATEDYVLGGRNRNVPIFPSHPFVGTRELPGNRGWNRLIDKLFENERVRAMFRRRLQTLVDEVLLGSLLDDRIDTLQDRLETDAALDRARWGQFGQPQSLAQALTILEDDYLAPRRTHLSVTHLVENAGAYPTAQTSSALLPGPSPAATGISIAAVEGSPLSGDQDEEFIELRNDSEEAIDLSGWSLGGGVEFDFLPGTIIEAQGSLFVSPAEEVFRTRATSPTGGEGLNLEGPYGGQISRRGELLALRDPEGVVVADFLTPAQPSAAQQSLRITEMLFAPLEGKDFEFIELRNIGANEIDLSGIRFTDGVDADLSGTLEPGEIGLVVSNPIHFPEAKIVGVFSGALNNGGEQVTLRDQMGENILSFDYGEDWFGAARRLGYSLNIRDENAGWSTWDDRFSWAVSAGVGGSPGFENPVPFSNDYRSWSRSFFSPEEWADPAVSGPLADASGNGLTNLVHYALGIDPTLRDSEGLPRLTVRDNSVAFEFQGLEQTPDITVLVEISIDLERWTPSALLTSFESKGDGTGNFVYGSPLPVSGQSPQFLRIRVIQN